MWSDKWIGKRYADLGRGPDAFDCLGLFLAVQRREFGRDLPDAALGRGDGFADLEPIKEGTWRRVDRAQPGDAFLFRWFRWWHIGTAVTHRHMLAIEHDQGGSAVFDVTAARFGRRLEGIYRYG